MLLPRNIFQRGKIYLALTQDIKCHYSHVTRGLFAKDEKIADDIHGLFKMTEIKPVKKLGPDESIGEELTGPLDKGAIQKALIEFKRIKSVQELSKEVGLTEKIFDDSYDEFCKFCLKSKILPTDLHVILYDIANSHAKATDLFPYFYRHVKQIFPHLIYMDDLKKLSDLSEPANWYPDARKLKRKIIYHCGPTNSGKTHKALHRFIACSSGIYCAPLKLLANEVATRINQTQPICDLITGDDKRLVNEDGIDSTHILEISISHSNQKGTIEMANLNKIYEVAVIDEIQMISDFQRGWSWTRAFLGLCAKEIHVCGDASAKKIIQRLCSATKDSLVVHEYKRLTDLTYLKEPLMSLTNVQKGDCFVCFNKSDIFDLARALSKLGHQVAIIYGSMPPGVKMEQARRFNDPDDPCKILISTDAIGMGLNFNIKRIIFNSLIKPVHVEERSKITMDYISVSQALQISGRAGRFNSPYKTGEVTTFKKEDLDRLHKIIDQPLPHIAQAGLHPTADQVELFSYHLPNYSLTHLLEIFITLSKLDASKYFMCMYEDIKYFAKLIEHIDDIPIRNRYIFVTAPINRKNSVVCSVYVKFIRLYSLNEPITAQTVCEIVNWPPKRLASNLSELTFYESIFDIFDLYLWLSMRFRDSFIDSETVKRMRHELDEFLSLSVRRMFSLTKRTSKGKVDSNVSVSVNDIFATKKTTTASRKLDEPKDLRTVSADFLTSSIITDILKSTKVKTNAADQIIDFLEKDE